MPDDAEHKRFRGGLARSERLLQLVIDTIPQRVFWKDRNSRYLGCNQSFARDAGLDAIAERLDTIHHHALLTPAMIATLSKVDAKLYAAGLMGADEAGLYKPT